MSAHLPRLADDEFVDEIRITTVPRFKTSGLSGDEWRVSTEVVVFRKGREIGRRSWSRLEWALQRLGPWIEDDLLCPVADPRMTDDLCMQPGCAEPWAVAYRMTKRGCGRCGDAREAREYEDDQRRFCERHARRGDSDPDDMDAIYTPVDVGQLPAELQAAEHDAAAINELEADEAEGGR